MKSLLAGLLGALVALAGLPAAASVGFAVLQVPDGAAPPIEVGVWYPAQAPARATAVGLLTQDVARDALPQGRGLPLVVISHGNGGSFASHAATAFALAQAGFVVAAPSHTGDTHADQSRATDLGGRTRGLVAVIDGMVLRWSPGTVDPARIGAFGFSAGAFTVLVVAGGVPDLARIGPHCAANPGLYDCRMIASAQREDMPAAGQGSAPGAAPVFVRDRRLRSLVIAAPALGFTFAPAGLAGVTVPVQLWQGKDDVILPPRLYAERVRAALPTPPEVHVVDRAGHFDFMSPCSEALARAAPAICSSAGGFDRPAFSKRFDSELVWFFKRTLER